MESNICAFEECSITFLGKGKKPFYCKIHSQVKCSCGHQAIKEVEGVPYCQECCLPAVLTPEDREVLSLKKVISSKLVQKEMLGREIEELEDRISKLCPHSKFMVSSEHIPGGYLDKSETRYYHTCVVCGHKEHFKTNKGGFD